MQTHEGRPAWLWGRRRSRPATTAAREVTASAPQTATTHGGDPTTTLTAVAARGASHSRSDMVSSPLEQHVPKLYRSCAKMPSGSTSLWGEGWGGVLRGGMRSHEGVIAVLPAHLGCWCAPPTSSWRGTLRVIDLAVLKLCPWLSGPLSVACLTDAGWRSSHGDAPTIRRRGLDLSLVAGAARS